MTADEKRERNRSYQDRFQAKRRGEAVPPRGSSHDETERAEYATRGRMTLADRMEQQHWEAAVRQHLDDVAKGDIPPAGIGSGSAITRTDRMRS